MKQTILFKIILIGILWLAITNTGYSQNIGAWSVIEYDSIAPASVVTKGTRLAYSKKYNSFYRWDVLCNCWKRFAGSGITDTSYTLSFTSPNLSLVGSGSSASLTNLYTSGYGLIKTAETWRADTTKLATRFYTNSTFFPLQGGTLTGTGGAGFVGLLAQSSTPSTPASGFRLFSNSAHNLAILDRNAWITTFDISATSNRFFTYPSVGGTFALGTGTANLVPLWTATNTLGSSNIQDNNTAVSILNSKPFQLGQWTTAGRPTGTANYFGWRDGTTFEWYNGTRWAAGLESTAARFTAGSLIFANTNGQADQNNAQIFWDNTNIRLGLGKNNPLYLLDIDEGSTNVVFARFGNNLFLKRNVADRGSLVNSSTITNWDAFGFPIKMTGDIALDGISFWNADYSGVSSRIANTTYTGFLGQKLNLKSIVIEGTGGVGKPQFTITPANKVLIADDLRDVSGWGWTTDANILFEINNSNINTNSTGFSIRNRSGKGGAISFSNKEIGSLPDTEFAVGIDSSNAYLAFTANKSAVQRNAHFARLYKSGKMTFGLDSLIKIAPLGTKLIDLSASNKAIRLNVGSTATTPSEATGDLRFSSDSAAYQGFDGARMFFASRSYARGMKDGNGIISALPSGNVNIKTNNRLYLKTAGGALGTDIYTGGVTYLKTVAGSFGSAVFHSDTTGNRKFDYGLQQDDRTAIQNGGTGRQITNLLTDYNPSVSFRWINGVRLDTTSSVHVIRIMWGDKNANEIFPTEFIFNAAMLPGSTASAYNFRTAHSVGRLSLNFDNGIYLRKSTKFFLEADSTLSYNFTNNTLQLSAYGTPATTAATLGKTESGYIASFATDGTVLSRAANTERYNTITSTSSPQTLSSTIADNLINQGGTQATFTFRLPASPVDGQISKATFRNAVTVLTINGNGTTVTGTLPTSAAVGQQIVFKNYTGLGWVRQLLLDYQITRDTTANDVDFTVTPTLLSSCQELVITAQLLGKGSDLTITLPTPSATYKGNKVGIFVVDVALQKVVISGSMYYTTDPALVTPTVQTSLNTETFYKSRNGAYYDFVCARNVDGNYYWKLKQ